MDTTGTSYESSVSSVGSFEGDEFRSESRDEVKEVHKLASKETKGVWRSKFLVVLSIVLTATLVSTGCYFVLQNEEHGNFVDSYNQFANSIQTATQFHIRDIMLTMKSFGVTITAEAETLGETFPFVTIPSFEVLAEGVREKLRVEAILYSPLLKTREEVPEWQTYSIANQGWLSKSREVAHSSPYTNFNPSDYQTGPITPFLFDVTEENSVAPSLANSEPPYAPIWHVSPPPFLPNLINYNAAWGAFASFNASSNAREGIFSSVTDLSAFGDLLITTKHHDAIHADFVDWVNDGSKSAFDHPHALFNQPFFEKTHDDTSEIVAFLTVLLPWDRYLIDLLPEGVKGITCVIKNDYGLGGQAFTYSIDGNSAFYVGVGDLHEAKYDTMEVVVPFYEYVRVATRDIPQHYVYTFHIYPSSEFEDEYKTQTPLILTVVVAGTFLLMTVAFMTYDRFVRRRNDMVVGAAARSNAIVSSLFPSNVRERLFKEAENANAPKATEPGTTSRFNSFINAEDNPDNVLMYTTKPIADLFPDTTILFADISGFTAWSSMREPTQVFILLETIYKAFDDIAKRRRVFKVETVGDCYVAVTGLPDPRKDHALVMARFARDCMHRMRVLVRNLELSLGPDTADLSMRFGLHSGPVTAGVLRGERSRFQLFGDTMNTASRMESTGLRDRIQVSQETADLLISAGKPNWIEPRADKVIAKGKGELQTYWLYVGIHSCKSRSADTTESNVEGSQSMAPIAYTTAPAKMARLIKWNVEVMMNLIRQIEASRVRSSEHGKGEAVTRLVQPQDQTVLDEVQDIVHLPTFDGRQVQDPYSVELDLKVEEELHAYINTISSMYRENPFHCFEHASHVTMSVVKLLARIVAPDLTTEQKKSGDIASTLHDHTYGITSDPLTQFACVFSALIHDVDHTGVSNVQLSKENTKLAKFYKERSVAEQNSVDLAWNLLMNDDFQHLRQAIYETPADQQRFRHLVVNSVMATDIMDKELKDLRNARWEKAFSDGTELQEESTKEVTDRKATIVIEHLIQASDVAHTMQHWHVYRKWNERLFSELYKAYVCGRADKNPADFWAKGELGFFDYYIIPLAKKLKDCGVFGVSSEEYLNYALKNRQEWEARGEEVVAEMVQAMKAESEPSMEPIRARAPYLRSFLGSTAQSTEGPASPVKRAIRKFGSGGIPFANTGELEMGLSNINIQPRPEASLLKTPTAVGTK